MLAPDDQLAEDILGALDLRYSSEVVPAVNEVGRCERWRVEQQYRMADALVDWLQRWAYNPQHESLREREDPLWQAISILCDHLASSQRMLQQKMGEIDEAAEKTWQVLWDKTNSSSLA